MFDVVFLSFYSLHFLILSSWRAVIYLVCDSPALSTDGRLREASAKSGITGDVDSDLAICMQEIYWGVFASLMAVGELKEEGPGRDL